MAKVIGQGVFCLDYRTTELVRTLARLRFLEMFGFDVENSYQLKQFLEMRRLATKYEELKGSLIQQVSN